MRTVPTSRWRHAWLPTAWAAGILLAAWASIRGPFDPTSKLYGANWPGDVRRAVIEISLEIGVLYVILRPWSYAASWKRALSAFLLFVPWTILAGLGTMHSGRVDSYHFLWLMIMTLALFATIVVSASVAVRHSRPAT